jgi:hypothetical protein
MVVFKKRSCRNNTIVKLQYWRRYTTYVDTCRKLLPLFYPHAFLTLMLERDLYFVFYESNVYMNKSQMRTMKIKTPHACTVSKTHPFPPSCYSGRIWTCSAACRHVSRCKRSRGGFWPSGAQTAIMCSWGTNAEAYTFLHNQCEQLIACFERATAIL